MFSDSLLQPSSFSDLYSSSQEEEAIYFSRPLASSKERCADSEKIERMWYWQNLRFKVMSVVCSAALLVNGVLVAFERHLLEYKWFLCFSLACYISMVIAGVAALAFGLGYIWTSYREGKLDCSCSSHMRW